MQRLKTRPQFQAALAGTTIAKTPHFALHCAAVWAHPLAVEESTGFAPAPLHIPGLPSTPLPPLFDAKDVWLGALVPKRWAKRAVTRNAIKRQIYTVSAQFEPHFSEAAHVVRLRATFGAGLDGVKFVSATSDALKTAVRLELNQLFGKISSAKRNENGSGPAVPQSESHPGVQVGSGVLRAQGAQGAAP